MTLELEPALNGRPLNLRSIGFITSSKSAGKLQTESAKINKVAKRRVEQ